MFFSLNQQSSFFFKLCKTISENGKLNEKNTQRRKQKDFITGKKFA